MNAGETDSIFSKMRISYDELRKSPESIAKVRKYYRQKAIDELKGDMAIQFKEWLTNGDSITAS